MAKIRLEPLKTIAYDADTDYQAIINRSVEKNDFRTAAEAERLRNAKIRGEGLNYQETHNYYEEGNEAAGNGAGAPRASGTSSSDTEQRYRRGLEYALEQQRKREMLEKYRSVLNEKKNAAAAESALNAQGFHETAAASGLDYGIVRKRAADRAARLKARLEAIDKSGEAELEKLRKSQ